MAYETSHLNGDNVLRDIHDPVSQAIRVNATFGGSGGEVIISHLDDSIRLGNGTNFLTSTTVSGKIGLDVNIIGPELANIETELNTLNGKVDTTNTTLTSIDNKLNNLDIRDLNQTQDNIAIGDGSNLFTSQQLGSTVALNIESVNKSIRMDDIDSNNTIIGYAVVGSATSSPVWRIQKLSTSGSITSVTWADGNFNFDNVWDNRNSLSYS